MSVVVFPRKSQQEAVRADAVVVVREGHEVGFGGEHQIGVERRNGLGARRAEQVLAAAGQPRQRVHEHGGIPPAVDAVADALAPAAVLTDGLRVEPDSLSAGSDPLLRAGLLVEQRDRRDPCLTEDHRAPVPFRPDAPPCAPFGVGEDRLQAAGDHGLDHAHAQLLGERVMCPVIRQGQATRHLRADQVRLARVLGVHPCSRGQSRLDLGQGALGVAGLPRQRMDEGQCRRVPRVPPGLLRVGIGVGRGRVLLHDAVRRTLHMFPQLRRDRRRLLLAQRLDVGRAEVDVRVPSRRLVPTMGSSVSSPNALGRHNVHAIFRRHIELHALPRRPRRHRLPVSLRHRRVVRRHAVGQHNLNGERVVVQPLVGPAHEGQVQRVVSVRRNAQVGRLSLLLIPVDAAHARRPHVGLAEELTQPPQRLRRDDQVPLIDPMVVSLQPVPSGDNPLHPLGDRFHAEPRVGFGARVAAPRGIEQVVPLHEVAHRLPLQPFRRAAPLKGEQRAVSWLEPVDHA